VTGVQTCALPIWVMRYTLEKNPKIEFKQTM